MKITGEQAPPELINLQPVGQPGMGSPFPIAQADPEDDAPC